MPGKEEQKMGGYGSGRWAWHSKKDTVDDCRTLSIFDLKREGVLEQGIRRFGSWVWRNAHTNEQRASIGYELNTLQAVGFIRLYYTVSHWQGDKFDMDYWVRLATTPCQFGGERWWFVCPLATNGQDCKRRVGKLYLPSGGRYFGCRHCYDLTYRSSQESDKQVQALKRLGMLAILQGMKTGEVDFMKGVRALPNDFWR